MHEHVTRLDEKLQQPEFRKKLVGGDVASVLLQQGIEPAQLPPTFLKTIGTLSEEELKTLASINLKARQARSTDVGGGILF